MSSDQNRIITTRDGSSSLFSNRFQQHYHNPNGALAESRHVFIQPTRLQNKLQTCENLNVLEVGFGTGLNLLLTADLHEKSGSRTRITYQSIEAYPISPEIAAKLDFSPLSPSCVNLESIFTRLKPGQNIIQLTDLFELRIFYGLFDDWIPDKRNTHIIYFDAFSPEANPELWTGKGFRKLRNFSDASVIMTTYCAASMARAAMAWAGWHVARAPGALGKREMTVAALDPSLLSDYKRVNEQHLAERYAATLKEDKR